MQALYQIGEMKAELEDMCQEEDDWHWQEDQDWHWKRKVGEEWKTWHGPYDSVCDSTIGKALDMKKVKAGRSEEHGWMRKMHVWDRVPRHEATKSGQKVVGTRWVYVDGRPS